MTATPIATGSSATATACESTSAGAGSSRWRSTSSDQQRRGAEEHDDLAALESGGAPQPDDQCGEARRRTGATSGTPGSSTEATAGDEHLLEPRLPAPAREDAPRRR